jgi:hypothetical protein
MRQIEEASIKEGDGRRGGRAAPRRAAAAAAAEPINMRKFFQILILPSATKRPIFL